MQVSFPGPDHLAVGAELYGWARDLFPLCRSITGDGVRQTLEYLRQHLPALTLHEVPTGTQAFDWKVPDEWNIRAAYIETEAGERIVDFAVSNLHVVGYSEPVDAWLDLEALQPHLYSMPQDPDAVPYVTSYYRRNWGFCLSHRQRQALQPGRYHVVIDSTLAPGALTYAEALIPGDSEEEVLLSSYTCHPSMANNELSGPIMAVAVGRWLASLERRRYSYRIVLAPETIGSIVYLSRHLETLKRRTVAGYVLSCIGDDLAYTMIRSRQGDTLSDRAAKHVLSWRTAAHVDHSFLKRGSDERNYCAPGVDLPVAVLSRTRFGDYPGYHTSRDNLDTISAAGLGGGFALVTEVLSVIEANHRYRTTVLGEPQLSKHGLYPTTSVADMEDPVVPMMNLLAYSDGSQDLIGVAERIMTYAGNCASIARRLVEAGILKAC